MKLDYVNIIAVISSLVTLIFLFHTIYESKKIKKYINLKKSKIQDEMIDYDRILNVTRPLECAREKNNGVHFEDESIYLKRASEIRNESSLFIWINES